MSSDQPGPDETRSGPAAAIRAEAVTKLFPGVIANDHVDFHVDEGEVHTLLGENGAGKSTLAAMLCGLYRPDQGRILRAGKPVNLRSPREGLAHGIGMVHQHFRLVERFTVAENVVLGDPYQASLLKQREIEGRVGELGEQFGLPVEPRALISDLTVGQRQRVEIVKMLYRGADVLLLDEPTAVLTPPEVEALFETVRAMTAVDKAVVFISHKLGEVMEISDRVTVMRAGAVTGEVATADTSPRHLAELMVGRPVEVEIRRGSNAAPGREVGIAGLGLKLSEGDQVLIDDVDIEVHRGEILGIAGVAGNGQRPIARALAGVVPPDEGTVTVYGTDVTGKGPKAARRAGLSFVPEDRLGTGLVPNLSLTDNMLLTRPRGFFVDRRAARAEVTEAIDDYEIKTPGPDAEARLLSGGNSQKVLLARELDGLGEPGGPQALIVSSPTRGLDIGAAEFVRGLLHEAREKGAAVLIISEDLDEVRSLSDRVAVLYRGSIALEGPTDELDIEEIGLAMAGFDRSAS
ncbi:MAG: ABC transporter ATP-binding protein [Acidimicrobiia bacterium]|nr:ABC transporter ATP-binding protein [Acidimicrobiia bacterium]